MSEPKPTYTTFTPDPLRPPVQDDWGWQEDEAEDIGANPLDLTKYRGDELDELRGQIRLLTAALEYATSHQDGQGEAFADKLLLDDVRAEFRAVYEKVPPVFQGQWYRVAKLLGVIK